MSPLPHNAKDVDLLKWVKANPNKPFDPNLVVTTSHTSDWEWQAVLGQMEELRRQNYITKLNQDPHGSTYWTINSKGENYLRALEQAELLADQPLPVLSGRDIVLNTAGNLGPTPDAPTESRVVEEPAPQNAVNGKRDVEVAVRALSDRPTDVDLLEFSDYAQALADFILSEKTQTPLTIGIDGPWGSGKTSLMRMIRARLPLQADASGGGGRSARAVWFDAWKYDQEESLWASLALEILSQVRRDCKWWERAVTWARLNWKRFDGVRFALDILKLLVYPSALIILAALAAFIWKQYVGGGVDMSKWISASAVCGLIPILIGSLKRVQDQVIAPFELNVSKYVRTPDYRVRLGFLKEFQEDFKFVVDAVTNNGKSTLVVFIDDLDRCRPAKPVEVIEALNQLLDADRCVFVIGMDVRSISDSIEAKYKGLADSSGGGLPLGYRFLEKIVQVPFRLPRASRASLNRLVDGSLLPRTRQSAERAAGVSAVEQLIETEENKGKSLDEAANKVRSTRPDISEDQLSEAKRNLFARTFDDDQEVRKAIYDALPYLESNARKVKRFINLFRLQLLIANRRHLLDDGSIEIRQLSRWLVLAGSWPEIVEAFSDSEFPIRLLQANKLWQSSLRESGLEASQAMQTLLKPYFDDPRIRKYVAAPELMTLLRSLVPAYKDGNDFVRALAPYLQLSV